MAAIEPLPHNDATNVPPEIRAVLSGLRWRIRGYVWLQGLALAATWIGVTFWGAMAIDYLPVLVGADEMPRLARAVLLIAIAAVAFGIVYRWVLRRTFVPLADRSLAILLERRYLDFHDGLITVVELGRSSEDATALSRSLLADTQQEALRRLPQVRPAQVFNLRPLLTSLAAAGALMITVLLFYAVNAQALETGLRRLYLLRDEPWPRSAHIEVVGVETQRSVAADAAASLVPFQDRRLRVARGSAVRLVVRADANSRRVPDTCTISYRTADGDRGRVNMTRVGRVQDGYQNYHFDGKPLRDILTNVTFHVVGFDHRVPLHTIEVVDRPTVVACELACVFPAYMVDPSLTLWLPRTVPLTAGTQLPQGTQVLLRAKANKELKSALVADQSGDAPIHAEIVRSEAGNRGFQFPIHQLTDNLALDVTLTDTDGIASERPYRIHITAIADTPPVVDVVMSGISTVVTPDVAIPLRGTVRDDYGVQRSWIELVLNDQPAREQPLVLQTDGVLDNTVDFRDLRSRGSNYALKPKDQLTLVVKAEDRFDLGAAPHVGSGDHYQLLVVTPDELLAMLEAREIGLRQRFEQIIEETTETRDMLVRIKTEEPNRPPPGREPSDAIGEDTPGGETADAEARNRIWSVRLLRAQQALMQSQKSAQETLGAAAGFREIRAELINNRVDTEDRKQRLQRQLAEPLERIGRELFPEFDVRLQRLVEQLDNRMDANAQSANEDPQAIAAVDTSLEQADRILVAMNDVLQNMLELETYNELLDIVRSIIDDQRKLIDETKKQQKKQVLDLLQ